MRKYLVVVGNKLLLLYDDGKEIYVCDCEGLEGGVYLVKDLLGMRDKVGFYEGTANLIFPISAINKLKLMLHGLDKIEVVIK